MKKRICTLIIFNLLVLSHLPIQASEGIIKDIPKNFIDLGFSLDIRVDKNTTEKELRQIKNNLAKDNITFDYQAIRNTFGEIVKISLTVTGKNSSGKRFSGTYSGGAQSPILPVKIHYDAANNKVSFLSNSKSQVLYKGKANPSIGAKTSPVYAQDQDAISLQNKNLDPESLGSNIRGKNLMSSHNMDQNTKVRELKQSENRYADQDNASNSGTTSMPSLNRTKQTGKLYGVQTQGKKRQSHAQDQDEVIIKNKH